MRLIVKTFLLLAALCPAAPHCARAAGGAMAPHKALYDIKMVSKHSGSQVINISGRMFYEWRPECEAWVTDHRFNLFYEYADSPPIRVTSDFSTYEPYDGKSFDFTSRRKRNGELYEEVRGRAERNEDGTGTAVYTMPPDQGFDLNKGTMFPMAHSLEILKLAREGKKFYNATVFDGSDNEGPMEINSFIGKPVDAASLVPADGMIDADLIRSPAWAVRMAFFPLMTPEADSEYEMEVVYHENGVISDMRVDYRDFSVTQKLLALEKVKVADCGGKSGKHAP